MTPCTKFHTPNCRYAGAKAGDEAKPDTKELLQVLLERWLSETKLANNESPEILLRLMRHRQRTGAALEWAIQWLQLGTFELPLWAPLCFQHTAIRCARHVCAA